MSFRKSITTITWFANWKPQKVISWFPKPSSNLSKAIRIFWQVVAYALLCLSGIVFKGLTVPAQVLQVHTLMPSYKFAILYRVYGWLMHMCVLYLHVWKNSCNASCSNYIVESKGQVHKLSATSHSYTMSPRHSPCVDINSILHLSLKYILQMTHEH